MRTTFTASSLNPQNPFHVGKTRLFWLDWDNKKYLVKDYCSHRGGPLSLGDTTDGKIICPWHKNKVCTVALKKRALPMVRVGNHVSFYLEE